MLIGKDSSVNEEFELWGRSTLSSRFAWYNVVAWSARRWTPNP